MLFFAASMLFGWSLSERRQVDSMFLSNIEALSNDEGYYSAKWFVQVVYYNGELAVKCEPDGVYQCPRKGGSMT